MAKRGSRAKQQAVDRITKLPQTMTENILCLLPIDEAVRTSTISREWRYKWTTIPKLVFNEIKLKKTQDTKHKFLYDVHQVLLSHRGPLLEFTLEMITDKECHEIDHILLPLSRKNTVKKLSLYMMIFYDHGLYKLPSCVFSMNQLTELNLWDVDLDHQPILNGFVSLKSLSLTDVWISTKSLLYLLSNSPALRSFSMDVIPSNSEVCNIIELFKCLNMIEEFRVSYRYLLVDSVPEELPALLIHLNYFYFDQVCFASIDGLEFLAAVIKCSPNLEKITMMIDTDPYNSCENGTGHVLEKLLDVRLDHLTELEIRFFTDFKPEMEFLKFILARSPKLKKVKIFILVEINDEGYEMLELLLRVLHASPVEIIVVDKHNN